MNVYTCTDHAAFYVGGASVIVAETELQAYELLRAALIAEGLENLVLVRERTGGHAMPTFQLLDTTRAQAIVLKNGDY